jgi:aspartate kinase
MKIFKFGGASVKDAESVKNVAKILSAYNHDDLIVVISAMGKTTNLLESLIENYWKKESTQESFNAFKTFHIEIIKSLFNGEIIEDFEFIFNKLSLKLSSSTSNNYHFEYDQIICFGELMSTKIVSEYLKSLNAKCEWLDARQVIKTNHKWREAKVDWKDTETEFNNRVPKIFEQGNNIIVTQGFIGGTNEGQTTSLGREGSDFTAAIFAYVSNAKDVTIWKDVPGMLNADPRIFNGTVLLKQISFKEAIELAYFGASVIHPKTIQPLKNKEIPLYIKSFLKPNDPGTTIQSSMEYDNEVASYIFKPKQILFSLQPKDFSFVIEDNLKEIFAILAEQNIRVNLMQNSAVSFSFLMDDRYDLDQLLKTFDQDYNVKYNKNVELLTVRHYKNDTIERLTSGKSIILEQKTRQTARLVLQ